MNKKIFHLILIITAIYLYKNNSYAFEKEKLSGELCLQEIQKNIFLIIHKYPWPANSLFIKVDKKNCIFIDTPYTPEATTTILNWFYKKYGKNIKITAINTGFHIDNLGGNSALVKNNIPVYGSDLTCRLLKTRSKKTMSEILKWLKHPEYKKYYNTYADFKFTKPTKIFNIKKTLILKIGNNLIEIYYPGPTHTYDNITVFFPKRKLLFGGCMIIAKEKNKLGFIKDANVREWEKSLKKLLQKYPDVKIVIPGHGNPGDIQLIKHTINLTKNNIE